MEGSPTTEKILSLLLTVAGLALSVVGGLCLEVSDYLEQIARVMATSSDLGTKISQIRQCGNRHTANNQSAYARARQRRRTHIDDLPSHMRNNDDMSHMDTHSYRGRGTMEDGWRHPMTDRAPSRPPPPYCFATTETQNQSHLPSFTQTFMNTSQPDGHLFEHWLPGTLPAGSTGTQEPLIGTTQSYTQHQPTYQEIGALPNNTSC